MRVALMDDYQRVALESADWNKLPPGCKVEVFHDSVTDVDALAERLADFDIVMALRERAPFPASLLERLPKLKMIASVGPRNAAVDVAAATRLGIIVTFTSGGPDSTSELTWGLILCLARHISEEHASLRSGRWQTTVGFELAGRTLGVIGLGHIGGRVAAVGKAFGMRVAAWSENLAEARCQEVGAEKVSLDQLLQTSDVVTIHTRLSDRTRGLLGAKHLAMMKPTAILINTSRGPIVDRTALLEALRAKRIAGAGLDVFDKEPALDDPLVQLSNVVVTPHLGYVTRDVLKHFYGQTLENILVYLQRGRPDRILNPEVLGNTRRPYARTDEADPPAAHPPAALRRAREHRDGI